MKAALFLLIVLAGCAASVSDEPGQVGVGECSAEAAQSLIGQPGTAETAQKAMALTKSKTMRWLRPGMAVTMDYRSDRLNITLDDQNLITRIGCG
jgi:Peptidase inhibitor I78 family